MFKKLPLLLFLLILNIQAQDKVKGSRNVKTEQYNLNSFHSIKISGELKVGILKGGREMLEIKADDNLHDLIQADVMDSVLYIKPIKEFSRAKSQQITITFVEDLKKLNLNDKTELESLQDLFFQNFQLEMRDKSSAFITLKSEKFDLINGDDSKVELNLTAQDVYFQLNQSSSIKALVNSPDFKVDSYEKSSARIEGNVENFVLRADQSASFDGENLTSIRAEVLAQGRSKNSINITEQLELTAKGNTTVEIYNNPKINLIELNNEAVIAKKEFKKGLF